MNHNHEKHRLMQRIQAADFALVEANLYLDTHPGDGEALAYYDEQLMRAQQARSEYAALFGPITAADSAGMDGWSWAETPWPWEMEA